MGIRTSQPVQWDGKKVFLQKHEQLQTIKNILKHLTYVFHTVARSALHSLFLMVHRNFLKLLAMAAMGDPRPGTAAELVGTRGFPVDEWGI